MAMMIKELMKPFIFQMQEMVFEKINESISNHLLSVINETDVETIIDMRIFNTQIENMGNYIKQLTKEYSISEPAEAAAKKAVVAAKAAADEANLAVVAAKTAADEANLAANNANRARAAAKSAAEPNKSNDATTAAAKAAAAAAKAAAAATKAYEAEATKQSEKDQDYRKSLETLKEKTFINTKIKEILDAAKNVKNTYNIAKIKTLDLESIQTNNTDAATAAKTVAETAKITYFKKLHELFNTDLTNNKTNFRKIDQKLGNIFSTIKNKISSFTKINKITPLLETDFNTIVNNPASKTANGANPSNNATTASNVEPDSSFFEEMLLCLFDDIIKDSKVVCENHVKQIFSKEKNHILDKIKSIIKKTDNGVSGVVVGGGDGDNDSPLPVPPPGQQPSPSSPPPAQQSDVNKSNTTVSGGVNNKSTNQSNSIKRTGVNIDITDATLNPLIVALSDYLKPKTVTSKVIDNLPSIQLPELSSLFKIFQSDDIQKKQNALIIQIIEILKKLIKKNMNILVDITLIDAAIVEQLNPTKNLFIFGGKSQHKQIKGGIGLEMLLPPGMSELKPIIECLISHVLNKIIKPIDDEIGKIFEDPEIKKEASKIIAGLGKQPESVSILSGFSGLFGYGGGKKKSKSCKTKKRSYRNRFQRRRTINHKRR